MKKYVLFALLLASLGQVYASSVEIEEASGIQLEGGRTIYRDQPFHLLGLPHSVSVSETALDTLRALNHAENFTLTCQFATEENQDNVYQVLNAGCFGKILKIPANTTLVAEGVFYNEADQAYETSEFTQVSFPMGYARPEGKIKSFSARLLIGRPFTNWSYCSANTLPWSSNIKGIHYKIDVTKEVADLLQSSNLQAVPHQPDGFSPDLEPIYNALTNYMDTHKDVFDIRVSSY